MRLSVLTIALLLHTIDALFAVHAVSCFAQHSGPPARYDGLTLEQWRERIKNLDLKNPASRAAVPGLMAIVADPQAPLVSRRQAAETLGRLGPLAADALPLLIQLLQPAAADEESTALWAAKALSLYGPEARGAAPELVKLLQNESRPLAERLAALGALSQVGPSHPAVLPALVGMLRYRRAPDDKLTDNDIANLRALAAESIALFGPAGVPALPELLRAAADDTELVRLRAVAAIGRLGGAGEPAIPTLVERFVFDEAGAVRDSAAESLSQIGRPAVASLKNLLADREPYVRRQAAINLGRIGKPAVEAVPILTARLDAEDDAGTRLEVALATWKITGNSEQTIPVFVETIQLDDRQLQLQTLRSLTALGTAARPAVEPLQQLLADERPHVRRAAQKALETIRRLE